MRCLRTLSVLTVTLSLVWSMTIETTSPRTKPEPAITENSTNQVVPTGTNATSSAVSFLDVRTPPKIQSFIKDKMANRTIEQSHAGVAIPLEEEDILEESTKKMNFYKLDRPTTNGGLSTWILLSGQTSTKPTTTKKPSVKPIILKDEKNNETLMLSEKPMKIVKPAFKQRSTTPKPVSSSSIRTTTVKVNTFAPKNATRKPINKVKASLLQNMVNHTTKNTTSISTTTLATTTVKLATTTAKLAANSSSASLPVEAKNGEQELVATTTEKKKKKKKKNKRRNKPEKKDASTKLQESAGTQLYSYLRSEIIPVTVGFSLVGLLVTAGLASYYLQPFAALRRNDQIDRKDTEGNYYYRDEYSNAVPEEEAIGKVIAGMPESSLQPNNNYNKQNVRYRHVDRRSQIHMNPFGSVEDVKLNDRPIDNSNKFVVGSLPKEVTPAVVPEHGPRNLKEQKFVVGNVPKEYLVNAIGGSPRYLRRKRQITLAQDDTENEIDDDEGYTKSTTTKPQITTPHNEADTKSSDSEPQITTPHNVFNPNERPGTFLELLTDLFKLKVKLGLELMQNVTNSVSSYVTRVQSRLGEHYRSRHNNANSSIS